jgi:Zn-dependent protease with chaperone function
MVSCRLVFGWNAPGPGRPSLRSRLGGLLLLLAVSGAAGMPQRARGDLINRKTEISLGREAASQVERAVVVDDDPVATARVRAVGTRLAATAEDKTLPFEFHLIDSNEVNAFALPGGFVYVYRGLLQLLPDDDALAFVLGHEMTHAIRRHGLRQWQKNTALGLALSTALGGNALAAQELVAMLVSSKFSRDDEAEADRRGIALVAQAGYDPNAAVVAMMVVKRSSAGKDDTPVLLRSHPATEERIRTLRALAGEWKRQSPAAHLNPEAARVALAPPDAGQRQLSGLEGLTIAHCDYWPLRVGAHWNYRVSGPDGASAVTVTVMEELDARPAGVFRAERDLGRGIRTSQLVAPSADRIMTRSSTADSAWQVEAAFAPNPTGPGAAGVRFAGRETVQVPAGRFDAARVERTAADGRLVAVAWYAPGLGLVRRQSMETGILEELVRYWIP